MGIYSSRYFLEATGGIESAVVKSGLSNHVVIRHILSYLALSDLKQCRLLNKFWKFEVDSYIRNFCRCYVKISGPTPCTDLQTLAQFLSKLGTDYSFINGLSITLGPQIHSEDDCISNQEAQCLCTQVIEKILLKHLEISWSDNSAPENCPAIKLVLALLDENKNLENVKTMKIDALPDDFSRYIREDWEPVLPKLEVLTTVGNDKSALWLQHEGFLLKITNGAPNLIKLQGGVIQSHTLERLRKEKYGLMDCFVLFIQSDEQELNCLQLVEASPKLSRLVFKCPPFDQRRYMTSFFQVLEQLLISNCQTLTSIQISRTNYPLYSLTCPPLVNVKHLIVATSPEESLVINLLQSINYPRLLPALLLVKMHFFETLVSYRSMWNISPSNNALNPSASVNIVSLDVEFMIPLEDLSHIFPNVNAVWLNSKEPHLDVMPYEELWACWDQLVMVTVDGGDFSENYDAEFLGIDPEEVEVLSEEGEAALEMMHIVPIRPSILTKPYLKTLVIKFKSDAILDDELPPDQVFLSKLTGVLAFKKMTSMGVYIEFRCQDAQTASRLNHLLPYVSDAIVVVRADNG